MTTSSPSAQTWPTSMAIALPDGREGRILAALLAVLALLLFWLACVAPVLDWYDARAQRVAAIEQRAAREEALIRMLPALKAAAGRAARLPERALLSGESDAVAGAALQEQVQGMAGSADAQLTSIETLPAEQAGAFRRIGVRVALNAQLPVVVALLKAIETAEPRMLIDDIRLTATPVGPQNVQLPLDAAFTVYAFRSGSSAEQTP